MSSEEWFEKKKAQGTYERNSLIGWQVHVDNYIIPSLAEPDGVMTRKREAGLSSWVEC